MDAGDADTYAMVRPPHGGPPRDPQKWWDNAVSNVRAALELRKQLGDHHASSCRSSGRSMIEGKLDAAIDFWMKEVGVDEVITRKFLSWDDNTTIQLGNALDPHLYKRCRPSSKEPCVWPFERLNVDTLGRIALCGQDISFRTAELFPNVERRRRSRRSGRASGSTGTGSCISKARAPRRGRAAAARRGSPVSATGSTAG